MSAAFDYVIVVAARPCPGKSAALVIYRGRFAVVFVLCYPHLGVFDYGVFRKILPALPDTYRQWQVDLKRKKAKEYRAYVAAGCSFEEHSVRVNASSFLAYCEEKGELPTVCMLYKFASEQQG